jgi:hypothetical protein
MWKWTMVLLLFVVGCDASDFYRQDTRTWFGLNTPPAKDKTGQASETGKTDPAQR